jgi:hypothetical protein
LHTADNIQQCIDTWEGFIHATGGQLEPAKTYWYLINFTWNKGRWRYSTIAETPTQLTMRNPSQAPIQLERLEVTEARPDCLLGSASNETKQLIIRTGRNAV